MTFSSSSLSAGTEGAGVASRVGAGVKVFHTSSFFFIRPSRGLSAVGALVTTAGAAGTIAGVAMGTSRAPACNELGQRLLAFVVSADHADYYTVRQHEFWCGL